MSLQSIATQQTPAITGADGSFKVANLNGGESRMDLATQWISRPADERFLSLDELAASTLKRKQSAREDRIETSGIEILSPEVKTLEDTHKMTLGLPDGKERAFTHHSFGQLCRLADAPAEHYRKLPSQIVADALAYGLRYNREVERVKTYATDSELLCATGPDYGRIFDHDVVTAVQQIAGSGTGDMPWKVPGVMDWRTMIYNPNTPITKETTTLYASDRDVFIFLVDDKRPIVVGKTRDGADDIMFRGFYISNSEMGTRSLKVAAFYLRGICCNRIMWGVEGFEEVTMRHGKYAPSRFIQQIRPALKSFSERSDMKLIEGVEKAKAAKVAETQDEAINFLNARKFSKGRITAIMDAVKKEEGVEPRTAWDFAQGITAVARNEPNNDTRVDLELSARKILDAVA